MSALSQMAADAIMSPAEPGNASRRPAEIPGCIARREPDAEYSWTSKRRLLVSKGDQAISLSADDLRALITFAERCQIEEQL